MTFAITSNITSNNCISKKIWKINWPTVSEADDVLATRLRCSVSGWQSRISSRVFVRRSNSVKL